MKWQVGDVTITQFVEIDTLGGKAYIMPQATPEALREIPWLRPQFAGSTSSSTAGNSSPPRAT
jgi:hypothetical protein